MLRRTLLVLASTYPARPGDGTPAFVRDLAEVEATGFDTTVLVPAVPGGAGFETAGALTVRRFRYFPRRWEDLADGAILENLRSRRSRWLQVLPLLVAEMVAIRRQLRRQRPDVLHVHWLIPQGVAALVAARGLPKIVTTLGGDVYALKDPISRRLIRAVLSDAAAVTTMNADMRDRLVALGADPATTRVLPMGADVAAIRPLAGGQRRAESQLLFVGRLVEKKGLAVLLEALRRPEGAGWTLNVVGDGPLRSQLEAAAAGLPVSFLGALGRAELAAQYGAATVAVFPSVPAASGDQDGLPVALLEAMSTGCPIVASDQAGLNEAVVDGQSGLLVPTGSAADLAAALDRLRSDADLRRRLGDGAAARADDFSVQAIGEQYLRLLDQVVTDADSGPDRQPASASR